MPSTLQQLKRSAAEPRADPRHRSGLQRPSPPRRPRSVAVGGHSVVTSHRPGHRAATSSNLPRIPGSYVKASRIKLVDSMMR